MELSKAHGHVCKPKAAARARLRCPGTQAHLPDADALRQNVPVGSRLIADPQRRPKQLFHSATTPDHGASGTACNLLFSVLRLTGAQLERHSGGAKSRAAPCRCAGLATLMSHGMDTLRMKPAGGDSDRAAHQQQRGVRHRDEAEDVEGQQAQRERDHEEGDGCRRLGIGGILRATRRGAEVRIRCTRAGRIIRVCYGDETKPSRQCWVCWPRDDMM